MLFNVTQIPYAIKMSKMVAARLSANTWRMSLLHFVRWQIRAIFHSYTSFKKHSISYTFTEYILWFIHITMSFVKVIKHNLLIASYDFFSSDLYPYPFLSNRGIMFLSFRLIASPVSWMIYGKQGKYLKAISDGCWMNMDISGRFIPVFSLEFSPVRAINQVCTVAP